MASSNSMYNSYSSDAIDTFNRVNEKPLDRFIKIEELREGFHYCLKQLAVVPTRYGNALIAELSEETHSTTFKTFLPRRYLDVLGGRSVDLLNSEYGLHMVFTDVKDKRLTTCAIVKSRAYV
jgi:hypothetical protein